MTCTTMSKAVWAEGRREKTLFEVYVAGVR